MAAGSVQTVLDALRPERIEAHLRFLADPLLEGRGVGTRGGKLAERYIRAVMAGAGLRPPPNIGYLQDVPMIGIHPRPELALAGAQRELSPRYKDEYVLEAGVPEPLVNLEAPLLFAGYGIDAPEFGWNDFGDLDVSGKVLLIRVNDPGRADRPDFFEGSALTYYGRWTYKFEEAARRGAAGVLLIHTDESAGYGWNVVRTSNTGEQYELAGTPEYPLPIRGWVSESVGRELLAAGRDPDQLLAASDRPDFEPVPLGWTVRARVRSEIREARTANVLGLIPGTDPERMEQPVVVMAHHDHLGSATGEDGEPVIYAGAIDNASGVALILAIAEAFAETGTRLPRPILFLASTAEESGLLGAEWYARHPICPLAGTAGVLNVDGVNLNGPTHDIAPLGVDRSTLGDAVRRAAEAEGLELRPEQHPEKGSFFRQDHFPFARAGIPGIAFDHGLHYQERPDGWGEKWYEEYIARHYHQPSDAFREDFDYRGALQQGRVMIRTALDIGTAEELPDWRAGSSFQRLEPGRTE